jgi:hypothetical protein
VGADVHLCLSGLGDGMPLSGAFQRACIMTRIGGDKAAGEPILAVYAGMAEW